MNDKHWVIEKDGKPTSKCRFELKSVGLNVGINKSKRHFWLYG